MGTIQFSIRSPADLARTITEARLAQGITQQELATATGIDRTYISRLENGLNGIQFVRLFQVLRSLGVEVEARLEADLG